MSNGVFTLDEFTSGNDGSSTDAETTTVDDSGSPENELRDACNAIGANYEHAKAYVDQHGNKDDLTEFAIRLANYDELWEVSEQYRQLNDVHRIVRNFLRPHEKDFTNFTEMFYGDQDDPEPGTYNFVQQRSREMDGNLMFYRALFPEPVLEYWDSDAVLWHQFDEIGYGDGMQDSNIYVTREWVEEYSDYSIQTDDGEKPVPPAREDLDGGSDTAEGGDSGTDLLLDPRKYTSSDGALKDALRDALNQGATAGDFRAILEAEHQGKDRTTAKEQIGKIIEEAEARDEEPANDDDQEELPDDVGDLPIEKVRELEEMGWEKEEIIQLLG